MTAGRSRLRSSIVVPVLFALAAVATFLLLGTWQLQRKAWKEDLIKTMSERISAAPIDLPARALWPYLDARHDEFRHVRFSATFAPGTGALVYAGAGASHTDTPGPGYWVFALARTGSGENIVINRGFVADVRRDVVKDAEPSSNVAVVSGVVLGVMRWPQAAGYFTPKDDPDLGRCCVLLRRPGIAGSSWRSPEPRHADGAAAQRAPPICHHVVRSRRRREHHVRLLARNASPRRAGGGFLVEALPARYVETHSLGANAGVRQNASRINHLWALAGDISVACPQLRPGARKARALHLDQG